MTVAPDRPLRADAERNRRRLLDAAADALASEGVDVSVSEIAHRAGVGQGTVFRRFPTKDALIAAVLVDRLDELTASFDEAEDLRGLMEAFVERYLSDHRLFEAAKGRVIADPAFRASQERLFAAIGRIVEAAHESGELRRDIVAEDLPFLVVGVGQASVQMLEAEPEIWRRYLAVVLDGLRPGGSPLPVDALSTEEIDRVCRQAGEPAPHRSVNPSR
jgi:AcrR family transcriptional regulator